MSEETTALIMEARKCAPVDDATDLAVIVHRLADDLEAATERVAELEAELESRIEDRDYWYGIAVKANSQRDAANEGRKRAEAEIRYLLKVVIPSLKAERDAAVAALERVRGVLSEWESRQERNREVLGSGALGHFQAIDCTGDLRAALDGKEKNDE